LSLLATPKDFAVSANLVLSTPLLLDPIQNAGVGVQGQALAMNGLEDFDMQLIEQAHGF